jgi:hypothetical protein
MRNLITFRTMVGLIVLTTSVTHALPSDNFNDNSMDTSLWSLYQESPAVVWLDETSQRLELRSTGVHNDAYADYYANAWGFSPTDDFSFRIDFEHDQIPPAIPGDQDWDFSVHLGLAKDWDNEIFLEAGYGVAGPTTAHSFFYCATIVDGYEDAKGEVDKVTDYGTLYISYDADNDELYLSHTGYWDTNAWITIPGLLRGEWDASLVFPYIGGWSDGVALNPGNAYLDNFVVDSGFIAPSPIEPLEQINQILNFVEESVGLGTLTGDGPGKSAGNRLNALTNMLDEAQSLIEDELYEEALEQLESVYKHVDGESPPKDFVKGEAAADLAAMIQDLVESILDVI